MAIDEEGFLSSEIASRRARADDSGSITGFDFGPDVEDVEDSLQATETGAIYLVAYARELFGQTEATDEFGACWEQYKHLIDGTEERPGAAAVRQRDPPTSE